MTPTSAQVEKIERCYSNGSTRGTNTWTLVPNHNLPYYFRSSKIYLVQEGLGGCCKAQTATDLTIIGFYFLLRVREYTEKWHPRRHHHSFGSSRVPVSHLGHGRRVHPIINLPADPLTPISLYQHDQHIVAAGTKSII